MSTLDAAARPDIVGCYRSGAGTEFFPVRIDELERPAIGMARIMRTFPIAPSSTILTVSLVQEIVQFAPFEKAVQILGHFSINAESTTYDAGRIEAIVRQFDTPAICGIGAESLNGLAMFGHDAAKIFAGRTVWVRPDAYHTVAMMPGVDVRRIVFLGPATALECAHGGLHYDSRDWSLETRDGTLRLSSRMPRIAPLSGLDTGVAGSVAEEACRCGTEEGRIVV